MAGRFAAQYQDTVWQASGTYTVIQKNFRNEMGFTPRVGVRKFAGIASYTWRPEMWRRIVRNIRPHAQLDYVLDSSGRLQTRSIDYHLPVNFQDGSFVETGINPTLE